MMKKNTALCIVAVMLLSLTAVAFAEEAKTPLMIAEQGYFSAGGTVTEPVAGEYHPRGQHRSCGSRKRLLSGSGRRDRCTHCLSAWLRSVPHGLDDHPRRP